MADPEAIKKLLDNKYVLFGLIGLALLAGSIISKVVARLRDKFTRKHF